MSWTGNLDRQIAEEFKSAQRLARGIHDRAGDEPVAVLGPRVERSEKANRRIVKGREG